MIKFMFVALLAVSVVGCKSEAEKQAEGKAQIQADIQKSVAEAQRKEAEAQRAAAAAERNRKQQARERLIRDPGHYLATSDVGFYDKGIIRSYRQLVKLAVLNKSEFAVANLKGMVEWFDKNEASVATVSFALKGSVPAGDTKEFSTTAGTLETTTLQTTADHYKIKVIAATPVSMD